MKTAQTLSDPEKIKLLSDPRRMQILRILMDAPATLTQLAAQTGRSPAWVRHHLEKLRDAGFVRLDSIQKRGTVTEKYYRATAGAWILQHTLLPQSKRPALIFAGSHDLALERIAAHLAPWLHLILHPVGSLNGLVNLRQGLCQVSGAHLRDAQGGYNASYVQHFFPDREMLVLTLAQRTQGLMTAPGNPKNLRGLADLLRPDVRFVNRNAGSGTRLWLDAQLRQQNLDASRISGYADSVSTHSAAALRIVNGQADAALGLEAAARQHGLDFLPLFEERFDIVLEKSRHKDLAPLLDALQSAAIRREIRSLAGYNTTHSGEEIHYQETQP